MKFLKQRYPHQSIHHSRKNVSKKVKKGKEDSKEKFVKAVSKSVVNAVRRIFPVSESNTDLLSAIELCDCYNTCDIRYDSDSPRL